MIFGKGESRRTYRTSNENLPKSAKIAAFWQDSYYSCLAYDKLNAVLARQSALEKHLHSEDDGDHSEKKC